MLHSFKTLLRSSGFAASLLILLVLIIQYVGAWYWLEVIRISKETELQSHLEEMGTLIAEQFATDATQMLAAENSILERMFDPLLELAGADSPQAIAYSEMLAEMNTSELRRIASQSRLTDLILLSPEGRVLFSGTASAPLWQAYDPIEFDPAAFTSAARGEPGSSLAYLSQDTRLKRVFLPIMVNDNAVAALCLVAGRDYLADIDELEDHAGVLSGVVTLLTLLIGLIVYRLLARQRLYEKKAAHADRLSSLGALAAGFAHEVRNPLEIIGASAEDLRSALSQNGSLDPEVDETCKDISEEVERLNRLVERFLHYSRIENEKTDVEVIDAGECAQSLLKMTRAAADARNIRVISAGLDPGVCWAVISSDSLRQILLNLVMNAIQATPPGGRVDISLQKSADWISIQVTDTGPGIPRDERDRIFEPFYTTRTDGSGLGLAIAQQIAAREGGSLAYIQGMDTGACFELKLKPANPAPPTEREMSAHPTIGAGDRK